MLYSCTYLTPSADFIHFVNVDSSNIYPEREKKARNDMYHWPYLDDFCILMHAKNNLVFTYRMPKLIEQYLSCAVWWHAFFVTL